MSNILEVNKIPINAPVSLSAGTMASEMIKQYKVVLDIIPTDMSSHDIKAKLYDCIKVAIDCYKRFAGENVSFVKPKDNYPPLVRLKHNSYWNRVSECARIEIFGK